MERERDISTPRATTPRKKGGWRAIGYILVVESFEKLSSMSLISNITVYLRTKYNLSGVFLVNVVSIWSGTSNIVTLFGAYLSDAYLGRFMTLFVASIFSFLGMSTMALTSGIPSLTPHPCNDAQTNCQQPHKWQLGFLFAGLGLLAAGSAGLRPCGVAFGADQFDTTTQKGRTQLESFFDYWYLSFTASLLIALTGVVYIQTNISWLIGFIIPAGCIAFSVVLLLMGRSVYIYKKPQGSVFSDMVRVMVASFRKRGASLVGPGGDDVALYDLPLMESQGPRLRHTDRFKWLDKAAIVVDANELDTQGLPRSNWRLCSIQQVEQLKCVVGIIPVWFTGLGCFVSMDQENTFGMLQAMQVNKSLGPHFKIPPAWLTVAGMLSLAVWIVSYEQIYIPRISKRLFKNNKNNGRLTMQQRIKTGIVLSIVCMVVAGIVEKFRRESALKSGNFASDLSIAVLLPQFVLSGLVNAFASVAVMEFFTMQIPETMRSISGSIFFLSLSIASYVSSFVTNIIHALTGRNGKTPWLGGHDLNKNRLDYYYYIIAALGVLNFVYFTFFAKNYITNSVVICAEGSESEFEKTRGGPTKEEEIEMRINSA